MNTLNMKPHGMQGKLITFCGLDGCGKSSMISLLSDELRKNGVDFIVTKQPTDAMRHTEIFRTFMDSPDSSAYEYRSLSLMAAADRIQHSNKVILPSLSQGKTVICDRYFYSCLANLRARGYSDDSWIYEIAEHIPKPDIAFFLDVPVEVAICRVRRREAEKDRYIDLDLQHRLRKEYINICNANLGHLISTTTNIDQTFSQIYKIIGENYDS